MSKLHEIHPLARELAWIEYAFLDSANNLDATGREIARLISTEPSVILIGAGMSATAGLPTASEFIKELVDCLIAQKVISKSLSGRQREYDEWGSHLADLEFDSMLGLLNILDTNSRQILFDVFLDGKPTIDYARILQITSHTDVKALFSTNFDTVIEKTAAIMGIEIQTFASQAEFPDTPIKPYPLPLFKLHGGVDKQGKHFDIQADFSQINSEINSPRLRLFKNYLKNHHLIVLGYGGFDFWDIYPLLFEQGTKGIIWVSHVDSAVPSITTSSQCYELMRIRDNIERIMAFSPGRVKIMCNTQLLLEKVTHSFKFGTDKTVSIANYQVSQIDDWRASIRKYFQKRGNGVLVDFGNILAACGYLELANHIFESALRTEQNTLAKKEFVEALLGCARTSPNPDFSNIDKAIDISIELQDSELRVNSLIEKAIATGNMDKSQIATDMLKEAAEIAVSNELFSLAGLCFANIGHQQSKLRQFQSADDSFRKAEGFFRQVGDIPQLFMTLRNHAEMYAIDIAKLESLDKALSLYLEALALSWGRHLNQEYKTEMYSRLLVILQLILPNPTAAIDYIASNSLLNQTGLAEHLIHRIVEYGYFSSNLLLEEWQHEFS